MSELIDKCKKKGFYFSKEDFDYIVKNNNKKRYAYDDKGNKIRANQGHSLAVDLQMKECEPSAIL